MQLVLVQWQVAWCNAKNFSQFTTRSATEQIHLPQTILRGRVTLTEVKILVVLCFDVRDATLVAANRDAVLDALYLNGGLLRLRCEPSSGRLAGKQVLERGQQSVALF